MANEPSRTKSVEGPDIQQRTYDFALRVLKLCRALQDDRIGGVLLNQLLRPGTAIGANVEEAQGGQSKKDFVSKMSIARKEAYETYYWLRLVTDSGLIRETRTAEIIDECHQICRIISAIIISARKTM